jgi:outer membrane usher protein FimD/PapC
VPRARDAVSYANTDANRNTYSHSNSYNHTYSHANGNTNTDANCDGYRYSQGYAAAAPDAASSSKSTVIAGLWLGPDRLCFSDREDGYSIYGFT